jgi:coproporphyrinogen III oxidase
MSSEQTTRSKMSDLVMAIQDEIVAGLEELDGKPFKRDAWTRTEGGGGRTCVLQEGNVFEKAGLGVSIVEGTLTDAALKQMRGRGKPLDNPGPYRFFAAGVSMVLHPWNPMAPTAHLNCGHRWLILPIAGSFEG